MLAWLQRPPLRIGDDTKLTDQLTERQHKILDYIRYVTKVRNYPPSVREIGEAVGLSSSSTVHNHLNQLERRGLIKRDPSKSRTVQLVQDAELDQQRRNAVSVPRLPASPAGRRCRPPRGGELATPANAARAGGGGRPTADGCLFLSTSLGELGQA